MKYLSLDLPTFKFIVGTRVALAFGLGLLMSSRLPERRRRAIGLMLAGVGALTTIPAAMSVVRAMHRGWGSVVERDARLVGVTRFPRKGDDDL